MSFRATLTIDGKSFEVLQCSHTLSQKHDRGKTTSGVRGGVIMLILQGSDEDLLGDWATGPTVKKDGDITFDRIDQQSTLQKLEFQDAYATLYFEFMASGAIDADAVFEAIPDTLNLDLTKENEFDARVINNTKIIVRFVERTQHSNCILLRLSAAKIKLDGIDHQNT
ncbi:hypothetical protein GCM10028819_13950 [Spirosoma humi]